MKLKLLEVARAGVDRIYHYHPLRVLGAALIVLSALGLVWGNFWLGHLLNTNWACPWSGWVWWSIPFVITASVTLGLFINSVSYLLCTLKKEIK